MFDGTDWTSTLEFHTESPFTPGNWTQDLLARRPPPRQCVATDGAYSTETHPFYLIHFVGLYSNFRNTTFSPVTVFLFILSYVKQQQRPSSCTFPIPHLPHNSEEKPGSSCGDASAIAVLSTVALSSPAKHVWVHTARAPFLKGTWAPGLSMARHLPNPRYIWDGVHWANVGEKRANKTFLLSCADVWAKVVAHIKSKVFKTQHHKN